MPTSLPSPSSIFFFALLPLLLLLLFPDPSTGYLTVVKPNLPANQFQSAFITFGNPARAANFSSHTAQAFAIVPSKGCQLPSLNVPANSISISIEENVQLACSSMTEFYQQLQANGNFSVAVMVSKTLNKIGELSPLGYYSNDNPALIMIPVSYIYAKDYDNYLAGVEGLEITVDNDLGPFYAFTHSAELLSFIIIFSLIYGLYALLSLYLFVLDLKNKGFHYRPSLQVILLLFLSALARMLSVIFLEQKIYYLADRLPSGSAALFSIGFWFPFFSGSLAYTITLFAWASIIASLQNHKVLNSTRKPFFIAFYLLLPFMIILNICGAYLNFSTLPILSGFLVGLGAIETIGFFYFGTKVLNILRVSSKSLHQQKSNIERRLTIFVLCSIVCWTFCIIFAAGVFLIGNIDPTPTGLFIFSVLRDLIICSLFITLLAVMYSAEQNLSSERQTNPRSEKENQGSGDPEPSQVVDAPKNVEVQVLDEFIRNTKEISL